MKTFSTLLLIGSAAALNTKRDAEPLLRLNLPLVGDLSSTLKSLPVVDSLLDKRDALDLTTIPVISLGDLLTLRVGKEKRDALLKELPLVGDLLEVDIPIVGDLVEKLPVVGDLAKRDALLKGLPIVGDIIEDLPFVGELVEEKLTNVGKIVEDLPVVGDIVEDIPVVSDIVKKLPDVGKALTTRESKMARSFRA